MLVIHVAMVEAVNRRLPASEQFEDTWWWPAKTMRLYSAYRRLYPDGPLLRRQWMIYGFVGLLWLSMVAWLFLG